MSSPQKLNNPESGTVRGRRVGVRGFRNRRAASLAVGCGPSIGWRIVSIPARRPERARILFDTLFGHGDQNRTLALIADGLVTVLNHVAELLIDAEILVGGGRYARARFLIATADEELGKCHLLLDCARLDVQKHESDLKNLSRAFYDHIAKYAYMRLWRFGSPLSYSWWDMEQPVGIFNSDRVEFWKATSAWYDEPPDEPDMPHNTYFHREMNLYVELLATGHWSVSPPSYGEHEFDRSLSLRYRSSQGSILTFELRDQTSHHLEAFSALTKSGALSEPALQAMNDVWRKNYVSKASHRNQLDALWQKTADAVTRSCSFDRGDLLASPLCFWPSYHALQTRPEDL